MSGVGDDIDVLTSWVATYIEEMRSFYLEGKNIDPTDFETIKLDCNELGYQLTECFGQMAEQALADHLAENNHVSTVEYSHVSQSKKTLSRRLISAVPQKISDIFNFLPKSKVSDLIFFKAALVVRNAVVP